MFLQPAAKGAISIEGSEDKTFTPVDPRIMLDSFPSSPHNIREPIPRYSRGLFYFTKMWKKSPNQLTFYIVTKAELFRKLSELILILIH